MPTAGVSSPNERSRIYLGVSLVDHHTLAIDAPLARFGYIYDLARVDGHFFTDKAPGSSLLVAAVYGTCRLFLPASAFSIESLLSLMRRAVMLPIGILGFLLFRRLARALRMPEYAVELSSLTWILGTAATHASAGVVGHQIVAVCLLAALLLLSSVENEDAGNKKSAGIRCFVAGLVAGFSLLTEYQSAIPLSLLGLYTIAGPLRRRPTLLVWLVLGLLPGVAGLLLYNKLAFGGLLQPSYHHLVAPELRKLHGQGIGGVTFPKWEYAQGALLSWHRGLVCTSPFFVLALPGFLNLWRRGHRRLALLIASAFAYYVLFLSSTEIWYAGWGFGPRLMVPVMGWAALAAGFGMTHLRSVWSRGSAVGLCLWGVFYTQAVNAVFPELPERFTNPLPQIVVPALREGALVPNWATRLCGWYGLVSLVPLMLILAVLVALAVEGLWRGADGRRARISMAASAAVVLAGMLSLVWLTGPPGTAAQTDRQIAWMHELLAREAALWHGR